MPGCGREVALGQHVGIGPVAGLDVWLPFGDAVEFVADAKGELAFSWLVGLAPAIPVVVGDAPHLRVFCDFGGVFELGWSGREAEHDGAAGFADGLGDLANLGGPVGMVADAVDLDVVQAPVRVELEHRVVVGLAGCVVLDAPVALIPGAGRSVVGGVGGMEAGAGDGKVLLDHTWRGMPRTMWMPNLRPWAWTQSASGLNPAPLAEEGKRLSDRDEDAVLVPEIFARLDGFGEGVLHVPAFVDDGVLPTVLLDAGEDGGVCAVVGFIDGEAVGIPAIPAQGRRRGNLWSGRGGNRRREGAGNRKQSKR